MICYKHHTGVIRYVHQTSKDICICGHDLKSILGQRIIVPPFVYKDTPEVIEGYDRTAGTVEEVMHHYVSTQITDPIDSNRKIEKFLLGDLKGIGKDIKWQSRFENLLSELSTIGMYDEIGFDVVFNKEEKTFSFVCLKGADLTKSIIFSRHFKNIEDYQYTKDSSSSVNTTYVGGDGEEELQYVEKVSNENYTGYWRREDYISAGGEETEEIKDRGLSHLKEKTVSETIETETNGKLKYQQDWDLGDFVTVKVDVLGETVITEKQITEVNEVYEHANVSVVPVFGNKKENIIKKIMKGA